MSAYGILALGAFDQVMSLMDSPSPHTCKQLEGHFYLEVQWQRVALGGSYTAMSHHKQSQKVWRLESTPSPSPKHTHKQKKYHHKLYQIDYVLEHYTVVYIRPRFHYTMFIYIYINKFTYFSSASPTLVYLCTFSCLCCWWKTVILQLQTKVDMA